MENMKVRIGYGLGVRTTLNDTGFLDVVDTLERLRFDSLWLSERIGGDAPDPLVAMAMAAARTTRFNSLSAIPPSHTSGGCCFGFGFTRKLS